MLSKTYWKKHGTVIGVMGGIALLGAIVLIAFYPSNKSPAPVPVATLTPVKPAVQPNQDFSDMSKVSVGNLVEEIVKGLEPKFSKTDADLKALWDKQATIEGRQQALEKRQLTLETSGVGEKLRDRLSSPPAPAVAPKVRDIPLSKQEAPAAQPLVAPAPKASVPAVSAAPSVEQDDPCSGGDSGLSKQDFRAKHGMSREQYLERVCTSAQDSKVVEDGDQAVGSDQDRVQMAGNNIDVRVGLGNQRQPHRNGRWSSEDDARLDGMLERQAISKFGPPTTRGYRFSGVRKDFKPVGAGCTERRIETPRGTLVRRVCR